MRFFEPKSYKLTESDKWIPSANILECNAAVCEVTEEYSIREKECNTEEEANKFVTEFLVRKGFEEIKH